MQAAREALVLLKNDGHLLPIDPKKYQKIAVLGYHGNSRRAMFGGYSYMAIKETAMGATLTMAGLEGAAEALFPGVKKADSYPGSTVGIENPEVEALVKECYPSITTILEELQQRCDTEVSYAFVYPYVGNDESGYDEALALAKEADLVVLTLGGRYGWSTASTTGEGIDATHIGLPVCQEKFLQVLSTLNKKTIGIHFDGRPISSDLADQELDALIEAWTLGQHGAKAIVDVLLGDYNPSGRLPVTVARNAGQLPIYLGQEYGSGRWTAESVGFNDYVDRPKTPRYPFGYGLSYSEFELSQFTLDQAGYEGTDRITATVRVTNTSDIFGETSVEQQCFTILSDVYVDAATRGFVATSYITEC